MLLIPNSSRSEGLPALPPEHVVAINALNID